MAVDPRPAREVIDQAIRENRMAEWLCYLLAVAFALVGVVGFFLCLAASMPILTVASSISSVLFWPAMSNAREIRKQNIAIRLLEVPLSLAATEKSAAKVLEDFFQKAFSHAKQKAE